jgi:hypothetical protein
MPQSQLKGREIIRGFQIVEPSSSGELEMVERGQRETALRRSRVISLATPEPIIARCNEIFSHPERLSDEQQKELLKWMDEEGVTFGDLLES